MSDGRELKTALDKLTGILANSASSCTTPDAAATDIEAAIATPIPSLLRELQHHQVKRPELVYHLFDLQRDWVNSPACFDDERDRFLAKVYDEDGKAWGGLRAPLDAIAPSAKERLQAGTIFEASQCDRPLDLPDGGAFLESLAHFSAGLLDHVTWDNVVLAGGSVFGMVTGRDLTSTYAGSDLDLFVYGLSRDKASSKVDQLVAEITSTWGENKSGLLPLQSGPSREQVMNGGVVSQERDVVTIVPPAHHVAKTGFVRKVQIVNFQRPSIWDVLDCFDLDNCTLAFDGSAVLAHPRAASALSLGGWTTAVNFFNPSILYFDEVALGLARRIVKYGPRGCGFSFSPSALETAFDNHVCIQCRISPTVVEAADEGDGLSFLVQSLKCEAVPSGIADSLFTGYNALDLDPTRWEWPRTRKLDVLSFILGISKAELARRVVV